MRGAAGALLAVALVLGGCGASPEAGRQQSRPNVLVLLTDDQTIESMRVMAGVRSELGAAGTTFERSFVSNPLCCPSRATLYTGQYTHNHGVIGNRPPEGGYGRLDKSEWLPVWLQRAGYHTVHIGKFMNRYGLDSPPTEVPPGWNEWYTSVDPSTYRFTDYELNENGVVSSYPSYSTDEYSERAADAVERLAPSEQPFFLSVAYLAPHSGAPRETDDPAGLATPMPAPRHRDAFAAEPLPSAPAFDEADVSDKPSFVRRRPRLSPERKAAITEMYRQELESLLAVDEGVVRVVDALRASGELDDTLIVFTSDNGFFHGEHRVPYGKVMVYEPSIRVPLILRGPGVPAGARRRQLVTNADLAPTILEAAGAVPAGRVPDGRSLFPLLRDRGLAWGRELLVEGAPGFQAVAYAALRNDRFVYVEHDNGERELYDLRRDPDQLENSIGEPRYAAIEARLAERLASLHACAGRGCRRGPELRLAMRGCSGLVRGAALERVRLRRRGARLRARVTTRDGRVVTLDRRLPRACR
ncbi:MAG TPA: sulfatase [Thermoleophilaceae bacterium]|nr:sulfatase [Thermoleophilaceae bacterium]